jgi:hypothetical protein
VQILAIVTAAIIIGLNAKLAFDDRRLDRVVARRVVGVVPGRAHRLGLALLLLS